MVVGICDDDKVWCREAKNVIRRYAVQIMLEIEVHCFYDREKLMEYAGSPLEILFLDIEMPDANGLEIAEQVNAKWSRCQIVYLTNYLNYATEIYHTRHTYYVLKEQFAERVGAIFGKIFQEQDRHIKQLNFMSRGGRMICLAPEEIYYFERRERKTVLETTWGSFELFERIEDLEKRLPSADFLRCHNSYIVYLPNVKEAQKGEFCMKNGVNITVSRGYAKATKAALARWILAQVK